MYQALIIDDNSMNIDVLIILLDREGISYTAIESPRYLNDALNAVEHFDVVFLDLEFPNGNGFKLLDELRLDSRLDETPIVAYTVHTSEIDVARRAGFDSFLGKPLDTKKFPAQVQRILRGEQVWET